METRPVHPAHLTASNVVVQRHVLVVDSLVVVVVLFFLVSYERSLKLAEPLLACLRRLNLKTSVYTKRSLYIIPRDYSIYKLHHRNSTHFTDSGLYYLNPPWESFPSPTSGRICSELYYHCHLDISIEV